MELKRSVFSRSTSSCSRSNRTFSALKRRGEGAPWMGEGAF